MVHRHTIFVATALALLAGAADAETWSLSVADKASSPVDHVLQFLPTPADSLGVYDQFAFVSEEPTPLATDETSSATFSAGKSVTWPRTFTETDESIVAWLDTLIAADGEPVVSGATSQVEPVAYYPDNNPYYYFTEPSPAFHVCTTSGGPPHGLALRGGWWDVQSDGSKTKTGEFQSLQSSEFWDADGL